MKPDHQPVPYGAMAVVYDALIDDVDYHRWCDQWCEGLIALRGDAAISGLSLLEIGAGTGNMTEQLIDKGFRVTALEPSEAMLAVLQEKLFMSMGRLRLFNGMLQDFATKETFDLAAGFLDVLNYIAPSDLPGFFVQVSKLLRPGGYATFDVSTPYKLEYHLGQQTFAENHDEFAFIWENRFDRRRGYLDFEFALFSETEAGLFERTVEHHRQYAHPRERLVAAAASAGLVAVSDYGDDYAALREDGQDARWHLWFKKA